MLKRAPVPTLIRSKYNYLCTADSNHAGGYFFYGGKTHNQWFRGVFREGQDFFDPLNCPERSEGPFLKSKKVEALLKNLEKSPIITSQTIRISVALVFLCIGVTICPIFHHFVVDYRFWTVNVWNRIFAKNVPKYLSKSAKTWKCGCFQMKPKTQNMYSLYSSLVERPCQGGVHVQSQANSLFLHLGSLHHKMKMKAGLGCPGPELNPGLPHMKQAL